jgi:hypothetical protein
MIIEQKGFIHHVFFWLKNEDSKVDSQLLIEGLRNLAAAPTIKDFHIGIPAGTDRAVVDNSYALSWLALFDSKEDHDQYQTDPVHLKFVEDCSHLWQKVVVFDTVNVKE